jgi:hypothetical protein
MTDIWSIVAGVILAVILTFSTYIGYSSFYKKNGKVEEPFTMLRSGVKQELLENNYIPIRTVRPMNTPHIETVLPDTDTLRREMAVDDSLQARRDATKKNLKKMVSDHDLIARAKRPVYRAMFEQTPTRFYGGLYRNEVGRDPVRAEKATKGFKIPVYISPPLDSSLAGMKHLGAISKSIQWKHSKDLRWT